MTHRGCLALALAACASPPAAPTAAPPVVAPAAEPTDRVPFSGGRLIGERTGGASGAPVTVVLPLSKATVTIPARAMYDPHGAPIEGYGVAPDDEVTDDRAAIATGHERAFEAAIAWACQRQPAPCP